MTIRLIAERPMGVGGHVGAPGPSALTRSDPASPGRDERSGGVGGHVGAPHVQS
jgi:hypothetical protein